ncbi:flavin reductase family protein [Arthrobacter alpinus]|nr:flavin reductase family protein [Arthrobacter alpinus]
MEIAVLTGETMAPDTDLDGFVEGLDYPMFIVTVGSETDSRPSSRSGCLVGFVTQCSIDPPRLLVLISKNNHTYLLASGAQTMGVHVVGSGQRGLAELFGGESGDDIDKFAACNWFAESGGVPVLADCRRRMLADVLDRVDLGDHVGFVLTPTEVQSDADEAPLYFSQIRGLQAGHHA